MALGATVVCVLGMHRSGTSLVARILNILGVHLGPQECLLQGLAENPKGFWEHQAILGINNEILARQGGSWHSPPAFPSGWESAPELGDLRDRAHSVIQADFGGADIWGWKDPRTCLTLPFWKSIEPPTGYVICVRHPVEVAQSLERRNDFPFEQGIYLWLAYLKSSLEHTANERRSLVFYEHLMGNWKCEVRRLSQFLGMPERAELSEVQGAIGDFIDADLRHQRVSSTADTNLARLGLPDGVLWTAQLVYSTLQRRRCFQANDVVRMLQEAVDAIGPEGKRRAWGEHVSARWKTRLHTATQELKALMPPEAVFILVDENQWKRDEALSAYRCIPFLERNGEYWGAPRDAATAIREVERLRQTGAQYLAFGWPAFWWLDYYEGLRCYLRSTYRLVLRNERLIVFDLKR